MPLRNLIPRLTGKNCWIVLEMYDTHARGRLVYVNLEKKVIASLKEASRQYLPPSLSELASIIQSLLKEFSRFGRYPVLLILDSRWVSSVKDSSALLRSDAGVPLTQVEVENVLSSALFKLFNRDRKGLGQKLSVPDPELALHEATVSGVRLDSHRVKNPVGFKAHSVEFEFSYQVTSKSLKEVLRGLVEEERLLLLQEAGLPELQQISALHPAESVLLVQINGDSTTLVKAEAGSERYFDTIPWGAHRLWRVLAETFEVDGSTARQMLAVYEAGSTSLQFAKKIKELLEGELAILLKGIAAHMEGRKSPVVYVQPLFPLPPLVWSAAFLKKAGIKEKVREVSQVFSSQNTGFELKLDRDARFENSALIASVLLAKERLHPNELTKIAQRRARWSK